MIASDRQPKHRPVGHDRQPDLLTVSDELKGARTTHHRHSHSATLRAQRGMCGCRGMEPAGIYRFAGEMRSACVPTLFYYVFQCR